MASVLRRVRSRRSRKGRQRDNPIDDVEDAELRKFRAEHGLLGATETLIDWNRTDDAIKPLKDGICQMRNNDGSWSDVRVVLWSSKLSIMEHTSRHRALDEASRKLPTEAERQVVVYKARNESMGLSIKGGKEFGLPILISAIVEGSPVDQTRAVFVGDQIIAINGVSLVDASHQDAVNALKACANVPRITLTLTLHPAARHKLMYEYLKTGDLTPMMHPVDKYRNLFEIPIGFCHVSRFEENTSELRMDQAFSIRSAFSVAKAAVLRPPSGHESETKQWVDAIRKSRDAYPTQPLRKPNAPLDFTGLVIRCGRVHERMENGLWRDLFMVLTDFDVALYSSPPMNPRSLENPIVSYPLLAVRYISGARKLQSDEDFHDQREVEEGCFSLKLPTGVHHQLNAGLKNTEKIWARMFQQRTDQAVRIMESITYSAFLDGDVSLTLHCTKGIFLNNDTHGDKSLIWRHPYAHIVATTHTDTQVIFDFGRHGGRQTIEVPNPSLIVFVLTAFIASYVRQIKQAQQS